MDEQGFREHLKRGGRSPSVANRVIEIVNEFAVYLSGIDKDLEQATPDDLESYVTWIEQDPKVSAKKHLWAIR